MKDVTVTLMVRGAITVTFKSEEEQGRNGAIEVAKKYATDHLRVRSGSLTLEFDDAAGHDVFFDDVEVLP